MDDEELLVQQRAYYQARAATYDEWWQRRGPYDRGPTQAREWDGQVRQVQQALDAFGVGGDVLELAGGTGWWTERLARDAGRLTVIDSSPGALELNRRRVQRSDIEYVTADIFTWTPTALYDVVFFSFWLSHVPRWRFESFWSMVRSCLSPGGRVFVIDNHRDPVPTEQLPDPHVLVYEPDLHVRVAGDGREYRVVKVMYEPAELEAELGRLGWSAEFEATRWLLFGSALPRHGAEAGSR